MIYFTIQRAVDDAFQQHGIDNPNLKEAIEKSLSDVIESQDFIDHIAQELQNSYERKERGG